jgi:tRNA dimethylallyltransferase
MAAPVIDEIMSRGKTPVIAGGSGLYLKFLTHGPAALPEGDPALRAGFHAQPLDELVARLRSIDPEEAARIALENRRYVERALEICILTGKKASELRGKWQAAADEIEQGLRGILVQRARRDLHERIAARTKAMLDGGAIEEVAAIAGSTIACDKAIGFREIQAYLTGQTDLATCESLINAATRQYAKRQETWFRREKWLDTRWMTED